MDDKIHIALCMGSSCFARGNRVLLDTLEQVLRDNNWQDRISLSGLRCEERCAEGPNLKIDGILYQGLDSGALLDLLATIMGIDPNSAKFFSVRRHNTRRIP